MVHRHYALGVLSELAESTSLLEACIGYICQDTRQLQTNLTPGEGNFRCGHSSLKLALCYLLFLRKLVILKILLRFLIIKLKAFILKTSHLHSILIITKICCVLIHNSREFNLPILLQKAMCRNNLVLGKLCLLRCSCGGCNA